MQCDMCGKEDKLYLVKIEGTELSVCRDCSRYGVVLSKPKEQPKVKKKKIVKEEKPEIIESVVDNFNKLIKSKREQLGLKQDELAAKLAERVSLLQKIETGSFTPSLDMARKLEKNLGIRLIEKIEDKSVPLEKQKGKKLTIGDVIKLK